MCTAGRAEGVGVAHHRADVEVVAPVLDRDVERVPAAVEVGDDRLHPPVPVAVDDVAAVARRPAARGRAAGRRARAAGAARPRPLAALGPRPLGGRAPGPGSVRRVRTSAGAAAGRAGPRAGRRRPACGVCRRRSSTGALGAAHPGPSCERIWASRAWASLFIDACSTSSMRLSTDVSVSSAMPLALA